MKQIDHHNASIVVRGCIRLLVLLLSLPVHVSSWSLLHHRRPITRSQHCAAVLLGVGKKSSCRASGTGGSGGVTSTTAAATTSSTRRTRPRIALPGLSSRKKDDTNDDDDDPQYQPGIEEAFRRLDGLGGDALKDQAGSTLPPKPTAGIGGGQLQISSDELVAIVGGGEDGGSPLPVVPLESEVKVYKELVGEMEANEDSAEYMTMMDELGGQMKQTFDTYSTVLQDLGGTTPMNESGSTKQKTKNDDDDSDEVIIPDAVSAEMLLKAGSTARFMETALQDAMQDVQLNNPDLSKSIMSDASLKEEIEKILEAGNEKLLESLAEIKTEQRMLAEEALRIASNRPNPVALEAQRLLAAEASMQTILQKVTVEANQVERAVVDLKAAQAQVNNDVISKLRRGGLPKQAALAGTILFAVRSLVDSVTAVTTDDATALSTALVQGAIAIACAILFAIL
jgi:hypothetical protein